MESIAIGRWTVELSRDTYQIFKDDELRIGGDVKDILRKYDSCFDKKFKPPYTVASVCLEDAMIKLNKKKK